MMTSLQLTTTLKTTNPPIPSPAAAWAQPASDAHCRCAGPLRATSPSRLTSVIAGSSKNSTHRPKTNRSFMRKSKAAGTARPTSTRWHQSSAP